MQPRNDGFRFVAQPAAVEVASGDLLVRVPVDPASEREFLLKYAMVMPLPDYFGINWDAFDECIRDLSWIPQRRIVLVHRALPLYLPHRDLRIYLEILRDAVQEWRGCQEHELEVVFPQQVQDIVQRVLADQHTKDGAAG